MNGTRGPFVPPPYPYDRLDRLAPLGDQFDGGMIDLSVGTPYDPPSPAVVAALAHSDAERGYPPSVGSPALRDAIARWIDRRFGVTVPLDQIGAAIGTKEFVGTLPQWMKLRRPDRDTVLYPAVSYPTYAMGATLAGCRTVAVAVRDDGRLDLESIGVDDADRALLLWSNSPSNPTGCLDDLAAAADWGRRHDVPVFSDECYVEFTWSGESQTILSHGLDGVVAVHSLSKRSNLAGVRVGFYAGDAELVHYLREIRKHVGMMVPGPAQAAGVAALDDDAAVDAQRDRYDRRLTQLADTLSTWADVEINKPAGGFYLWFRVGDAWQFVERLAKAGGALVSPGEFFGDVGASWVRVAAVQPDERIATLASRLERA